MAKIEFRVKSQTVLETPQKDVVDFPALRTRYEGIFQQIMHLFETIAGPKGETQLPEPARAEPIPIWQPDFVRIEICHNRVNRDSHLQDNAGSILDFSGSPEDR